MKQTSNVMVERADIVQTSSITLEMGDHVSELYSAIGKTWERGSLVRIEVEDRPWETCRNVTLYFTKMAQ